MLETSEQETIKRSVYILYPIFQKKIVFLDSSLFTQGLPTDLYSCKHTEASALETEASKEAHVRMTFSKRQLRMALYQLDYHVIIAAALQGKLEEWASDFLSP